VLSPLSCYSQPVESLQPLKSRNIKARFSFLRAAFLLAAFPRNLPARDATGRYNIYCDGVGLILANIDGAAAPGKLVLFLYVTFPPGTIGGRYIGQGKWSYVYVFRDGCIPDGKCEKNADGKVWIDAWDTAGADEGPPKRISGKYEVDLNGKHLEGEFTAKLHSYKHPFRLCM
jgi:hypothetical protein